MVSRLLSLLAVGAALGLGACGSSSDPGRVKHSETAIGCEEPGCSKLGLEEIHGSGKIVNEEGKPTNCFKDPELEEKASYERLQACGYPSPLTVGAEAATGKKCSELPEPTIGATWNGERLNPGASETIEGKRIPGFATIEKTKVTLRRDCVILNGGESEGSVAVKLTSGGTNFTITESTVEGENKTTKSVAEAVGNNESASAAVATKDVFKFCDECIHQAPWTVEETYAISNGREKAAEESKSHTEIWYIDNNKTITGKNNTFINPNKETAVIESDMTNGGEKRACTNHVTMENSLITGGGNTLDMCSNNNGSNSGSTLTVKNVRFVRRVCTEGEKSNYQGAGGWGCKPEKAEWYWYGNGTGAYHPHVGFFHLLNNNGLEVPLPLTTWENNYLDNNLEEVQDTGDVKCAATKTC